MKYGAIVERLVVLDFHAYRVGPVLGALSQFNEVFYCIRRLPLKKLAGDAANGGVHHNHGPLGKRHRLGRRGGRIG